MIETKEFTTKEAFNADIKQSQIARKLEEGDKLAKKNLDEYKEALKNSPINKLFV